MSEPAYYNEFDPQAAQWLRNLIAAGEIAPGHVDDRSIEDVRAADLVGYRQCHFFAGVGGWSRAARIAGWPDDRRLWTGSPPCQPYSVAGKGEGFDDERDLWPEFFRLIRDARPDVIVGEQVAAAIRHGWLDRMHDDLEGIAYACKAIVLPACAVDAPHRRDRLWFIAADARALADGHGSEFRGRRSSEDARSSRPSEGVGTKRQRLRLDAGNDGRADGVTHSPGLERHAGHGDGTTGWAHAGRPAAEAGSGGDVADCFCGVHRSEAEPADHDRPQVDGPSSGACGRSDLHGAGGDVADRHQSFAGQEREQSGEEFARPSGHQGHRPSFWSDAEWIVCHDGKARRVKPGLPLLVDGLPGGMVAHLSDTGQAFACHRATALKGFGNAIVPELGAELLSVWMECAG